MADDHTVGGDPGHVYEFLGDNNTLIDLADEDFDNPDRWESLGTPLEQQIPALINTISGYFSSNFGLNGSFDTWTMATASGEKLALAGAGTVFVLDQTSDARIREGARINVEGADSVTNIDVDSGRSVSVTASSQNDALSAVGNIKLPGISAPGSFNLERWKESFSKDKFSPKEIGNNFLATQADSVAIGAAFTANILGSQTHAEIESDVVLMADSLDVSADHQSILLGVGSSGGKSQKVAFNASAVANVIQNSTQAWIADNSYIRVGSGTVDSDDSSSPALRVSANDASYMINLTGSFNTGGKAAVGASAGVSVLERDTRAMIGREVSGPWDDSPLSGLQGSIVVDGDALVASTNSGVVIDLAVAGSVAGKSKSDASSSSSTQPAQDDPGKWPNNQANYNSVIGQLQGNLDSGSGSSSSSSSKIGVGLSGSVVVHVGDDNTVATIRGLDTMDVNGRVDVAANDATQMGMFAGGAAISLSQKAWPWPGQPPLLCKAV
ncbi:hypothetical protein HLB35_15605 [Halomonas sp. TBZ9]|uniref:Uncharacterized protein n=1 Tax=Vreelandella azerica TaxID=2732867 RepID=A0A7Y3U237_9GAMM|nr:hypothetical protein [Halomonas azerica]NOG32824.1 hypothetical protein [Halomonas azerica]